MVESRQLLVPLVEDFSDAVNVPVGKEVRLKLFEGTGLTSINVVETIVLIVVDGVAVSIFEGLGLSLFAQSQWS